MDELSQEDFFKKYSYSYEIPFKKVKFNSTDSVENYNKNLINLKRKI